MQEQENQKTSTADGRHIRTVLLVLAVVAVILISLFVSLGSFGITGKAEDALRRKIAQESGGQIELASFQKTDGQKGKVFGVEAYFLSFTAEISFRSDGFWLTHDFQMGPGLTFEFQENLGAFDSMHGAAKVSAGKRARVTGRISGQKSEKGWTFRVGDCEIVSQ